MADELLTLSWRMGLEGGVLIGLAAASLFWLNGRIAGISGVLAGLLRRAGRDEVIWRLAFLAGLLLAGSMAMPAPAMVPGSNLPLLLVSGLLVGFGTRLGNGCTSGHGVCGIGRLSWRSLVATMTFMAAGFVTVFLLRHGGF